MQLKKVWNELVNKLNTKGIPLPTIRDPKTKEGSVSLTLVFISFNMVLVGLVGKWAGALGGIDLNQALNLFYACAALYWGRKIQGGDSTSQKPQDPSASDATQKVDSPD
jgi:hypothetical protein